MRRSTVEAYLLDEDVLLKGQLVKEERLMGLFTKRKFYVNPSIQCGFGLQIIRNNDIGKTLFYSREHIKSAGLGHLEVVQ